MPLTDLKLIDMTDGLAGPMCTHLLSDYGIDMVRVDRPGALRTPADLVRLRGRRSIAIDMSSAKGRQLTLKLIARADVLLLEQGLDGTYRLDATYEELAAENPRLIVCRISGYGLEGPMAGRWAHDHLVAARYGVYNQRGWRDGPTFLTSNVPSLGAALLAMQAIGTALFLRERSGHGQEVQTSLLAGALAFQPGFVSAANDMGPPTPQMNMRTPFGALPFYSIYECSDGRYLHFGCLSAQFQERAAAALGIEAELLRLGFATPRQQENIGKIVETIATVMAKKTFDQWAEVFEKADVPYAESSWTEDRLDDPQVTHEHLAPVFRDPTVGQLQAMGAAVTSDDDPWEQPIAAPMAGQHTDAICEDLGLTDTGIAALRAEGVIA